MLIPVVCVVVVLCSLVEAETILTGEAPAQDSSSSSAAAPELEEKKDQEPAAASDSTGNNTVSAVAALNFLKRVQVC